jgi:hypothetical protein
VVSRTWTNIVRFAVAALLGLSACLVAWWPQSAAGSGETATYSPVAAAPTQKTPTPTKPPTATVAPTTAAPPPPPASPTHKPTKKPTHKPTHRPTTLHNNGGSNHNSGGSSHKPPPAKPTHSTVSTSAPYVPPVAPTTSPAKPTSTPTPSKPTATPTTTLTTATPTAAASPTEAVAKPDKAKGDGADDADTYDTYLTSSAPVETKSAPVWVVPGILIVLTSMLALLGGVLGRGTRPAVARVKTSNENPSDDTP